MAKPKSPEYYNNGRRITSALESNGYPVKHGTKHYKTTINGTVYVYPNKSEYSPGMFHYIVKMLKAAGILALLFGMCYVVSLFQGGW